MYRLESLVFLWPRRVYGGSCQTSPFRRCPSPKQVVMSFCRAGTALRDIPTCLTCRNWFCVAGAILLRRFHKMSCSFRGRRRILALSSFCVAGAALQTCRIACSTLHTPHSALPTLHSVTPHFTLYTPHFTFHTLHSTLYTLHSTLRTLHFRLRT